MNDFTVISAVSQSLLDVLKAGITASAEPQLTGVPVYLLSPKEMRQSLSNKTGVSLWLYRIGRNADLLNAPPRRISPTQVSHYPVPLDLHFLVTPLMQKPEDEQALLGRVVQLFSDSAILRGAALRGALAGSGEEFRLMLETLSLEELTRVWAALMESYQLSLSYQVQLVTVDSPRPSIQESPVLTRETQVTQILTVS
ncbi:MAG: DUF4255 domain-containing protein [Chloroflexi bacterium]|nr:DUF4255 domain-containing protein [Chloroflexota bacterium]